MGKPLNRRTIAFRNGSHAKAARRMLSIAETRSQIVCAIRQKAETVSGGKEGLARMEERRFSGYHRSEHVGDVGVKRCLFATKFLTAPRRHV